MKQILVFTILVIVHLPFLLKKPGKPFGLLGRIGWNYFPSQLACVLSSGLSATVAARTRTPHFCIKHYTIFSPFLYVFQHRFPGQFLIFQDKKRSLERLSHKISKTNSRHADIFVQLCEQFQNSRVDSAIQYFWRGGWYVL